MIAYLTRAKDSSDHGLPSDCPWVSWYWSDGDSIVDNSIIVTEEEFSALMATWNPIIQKAKDKARYRERAKIKDELIVGICADNMERVRQGIWTVSNLIELTADTTFKNAQDDINSLSFELAQGKIMSLSLPFITTEIKLDWVARLQENLFNNIEV
jgi:hypothetical protein